jgi:hypothetical protein
MRALQWAFAAAAAGSIVLGPSVARAYGGSWSGPITVPNGAGVDTSLLLTDGRVMLHEPYSPTWVIVSPDIQGNYGAGSSFTVTSMPPIYGPQFFASAVLPDGKAIVAGGELNLTTSSTATGLAYLYDPTNDTWTFVPAPSGWNSIGDAPCIVLTNGTFMLGNAFSSQSAQLNEANLTWTMNNPLQNDFNNEEGWTLLRNGEILTVSTHAVDSNGASFSELFDVNTGLWQESLTTTGTPVEVGNEIGASILMASGLVLQVGAGGHNSIYNPATGLWTPTADLPLDSGGNPFKCDDAPASLLPNGNVLVAAHSDGTTGVTFFEFDGSQFHLVASPPHAPDAIAFNVRLLTLPSGQVLQTDASDILSVYTPAGSANPSWAPTLPTWGFPSSMNRGSTYTLFGTQFNGLSQASAYGDDAQNATNYPLARIRNKATGHVFYARTHNHSWMGVASGQQTVSTQIDVPTGCETGASTLTVVANGIASQPVNVTID